MRAIDTNVVVRFIAQDDPDQTDRATRLIAAGDIFVATSVILESEWVLRRGYHFSRDSVVRTLRAFVSLPGITTEHAASLASAFEMAQAGMDFADAIHLCRTENCESFVSFDRHLAKTAARQSAIPVVEP